MIALTQTLLPEPVAPAMSRCGIFDRSALEGCPATSWPSAKASFERLATSPWMRLASTSFRVTRSNAEFGISTPTYGSPGIGASIRMLRAASASARLSDSPSIRLSLMPGLDVERVLGDDRPFLDSGDLHADAEVRERLADALALGGEVHLRGARLGCVGEEVERRELPDALDRPRARRRTSPAPPPWRDAPPRSAPAPRRQGVELRSGRSSATTGIGVRDGGGPVRAGRRPLATHDHRRLVVDLGLRRRSRSRTRSRSPARAAAGRRELGAIRGPQPSSGDRRSSAASSASSRRGSRPAR